MARKLFLLFTGCLSLHTTLLQAQNTAQQTTTYSLNQLAVRVADEPVPLQSDLARIALTELAVHARVDGDEQVIFNGTGHYLRLPLPTLAPRRELLKRVRPWLAAKAKGTPVTFVILNAGPLLE